MNPTERAPWEILVSENASAERSFQLSDGSLFVGASPACEVVTTAPGVAPRHAEFVAAPGTLQLRALEENPPVLLNGAPVHGLVDVRCPATVQIGSLYLYVKKAAANGPSKTNPDSTLRIIHPVRPEFGPLTDPKNLDVTGRIVYRLPGTEDTVAFRTASSSTKDTPLQSTSFREESTMAFSLEELEISFSDKVPVRVDYQVKDEIARGGMGRIFSAEDTSLDRHVALKVSTVGDPDSAPQFFREAKILASLAHPNIVPIHNLGVDEAGRPFYSMKLIQGRTLQSIIKQLASGDKETAETYPRMRLLEIFRKVCDAVSFAHAKGYLHRDLKPENIMVGEFGEVLVMDWGLAKTIRRPSAETAGNGSEEDEPETLPYIEGTPQYMSPEQANGVYGGLDERSDIYSLGGILYAILTLRPPVIGASLNEVLDKVRNGETTTMVLPLGSVKPESPARSAKSVPEALQAVTLKALSKEKDRRYQSVGDLSKDIEAYLGGFATQAEGAGLARHIVLLMKRHRLASALAGVALLGALIFTARLTESEQKANANATEAGLNAKRAEQEAARATANADEAKRNATRAEEEARIAAQNEQQAKQEKEESRKAHARTQIALAEAAEQAQNAEAMQRALVAVPEDLRDRSWIYLSKLADSAEVTIENKASSAWHKFEPHPLDPDLVFTLHEDGWIRTVNLKTGAMEDVFKTNHGHRTQSGLGISPDAQSVAVTGIHDNRMQVNIFNLHTGKWKAGFELPQSNRAPYLKFSTNSETLLASIPSLGQIYVLDVIKNSLRWTWEGKKQGLAYLSDNEKSVLFWPYGDEPVEFDILNGDGIAKSGKGGFKMGNTTYESFAFMPGNPNAFALLNGALRQFEIGSGRKLFDERLPSGSARLGRLALLAQESLVVTLSAVSDGAAVMLVHDSIDGHVLQRRLIAMKKTAGLDWTLLTHPVSKRIAVACGDTLKVWSIPYPLETHRIKAYSNSLKDDFWFSKNPAVVCFVASAKRIPPNKTQAQLARKNLEKSESDTPADASLLDLNKDTHAAIHLSANRNGDLVGTQFAQDHTLVIWRNQNNTLVEVNRFEVPGYSILVEMSPTGRLVWSHAGSIETASGKPLQKLNRKNMSEHPEEIPPVWLKEQHVAEVLLLQKNESRNTGETERSIVLWSTGTDDPAAIANAPEAKALAASPDGGQIAEAGKDMRVRIRNGTTLAVERTLRVHDDPVISVAWHPTLPLLATASEDFSVRIWDLRTDTLVEEFRSNRNTPALRLKWSPDGRFLGVSYQATTENVKIYEPEACKETDRSKR